jgi:hypothetical protein
MFELARGYKNNGMTAYSRLQEKEFHSETQYGYEGAKHQRFVGTGYFDAVTQVIAAGQSSTTALDGSTEQDQFSAPKLPVTLKQNRNLDTGHRSMLGDCSLVSSRVRETEDMLLPSGD